MKARAQADRARSFLLLFALLTLADKERRLTTSTPAASTPSATIMAPTSDDRSSNWSFATQCATIYDPLHPPPLGASSYPLFQCTTFKGLPGSDQKISNEFDYSRSGNPTRTVLQNHMSKLQGCKHSFAVSTGMACLDTITRMVRPNEVILAGNDIYGGTSRLLTSVLSHGDVKAVHVDMTQPQLVEEAVRRIVEGGAKLGMVSSLEPDS